jgi:hypothetical protein
MFLALPTCNEDQVRTSLVFSCPWVKPTDIRSIKVLEAQRESPKPEALPWCREGGRGMNEMKNGANDRLRIRKLQH